MRLFEPFECLLVARDLGHWPIQRRVERQPLPIVKRGIVSLRKSIARDLRAPLVVVLSSTMYGGKSVWNGLPSSAWQTAWRCSSAHSPTADSDLRQLVERVEALPFGLRVAAVDRLGPVESRIAARNRAVVDVEDVAVASAYTVLNICRLSTGCSPCAIRRSCGPASSPVPAAAGSLP